MEEWMQHLTTAPLFRGIPEPVLVRDILPLGQLQELPRDYYLFAPQQQAEQFGVILSGRVHITHIFPDGSFSLINVLTARDAVGADLICTRSRVSPHHAITATACRILLFPAAVFLEPGHLEESTRQTVLGNLLTTIADENIKKEYRLAILSQKGLRERILAYLTMQAAKRRTNTFTVPFSREEMASFLCVNRSALSHELSLLQQEGRISFRKNRFTLHDFGEDVTKLFHT